MAKWETCSISDGYWREVVVKSGLFSTRTERFDQWVATETGATGSYTIYESEEWQIGTIVDNEKRRREEEKRRREYDKMISYLLSEGWEPAQSTREDGSTWITLMKRRIIESDPQAASDPANLLKQLANLHEAGILTDQEFEAKKVELLKRM